MNVSPFYSVVDVREPLASKLGFPANSTAWTYHPELVPGFNPYYLKDGYPVVFWRFRSMLGNTRQAGWQQEVRGGCGSGSTRVCTTCSGMYSTAMTASFASPTRSSSSCDRKTPRRSSAANPSAQWNGITGPSTTRGTTTCTAIVGPSATSCRFPDQHPGGRAKYERDHERFL